MNITVERTQEQADLMHLMDEQWKQVMKAWEAAGIYSCELEAMMFKLSNHWVFKRKTVKAMAAELFLYLIRLRQDYRIALSNPVHGVWTRAALEELLLRFQAYPEEDQVKAFQCLVMFDLDDLKGKNTRYTKLEANRWIQLVLSQVRTVTRSIQRPILKDRRAISPGVKLPDMIFQIHSGDEFGVLIPCNSKVIAEQIVKRIEKVLASSSIQLRNKKTQKFESVPVSACVSYKIFNVVEESIAAVIDELDEGLEFMKIPLRKARRRRRLTKALKRRTNAKEVSSNAA